MAKYWKCNKRLVVIHVSYKLFYLLVLFLLGIFYKKKINRR